MEEWHLAHQRLPNRQGMLWRGGTSYQHDEGKRSIVNVADFSPLLRRAIMLAREAGLKASATELEERVFGAHVTASEWLGEVGEAIRQFRSREGARVPAEVARALDDCLREVGKVWPKYAPGLFGSLLARISRPWPR